MTSGEEVELKQWRIFYDSTLVGYLPQMTETQIQALFDFPHDQLTQSVIASFEEQTARKIGVDKCKVLEPEKFSKAFVERAIELREQEEESDDE